jgi:predicted trehalose synthase
MSRGSGHATLDIDGVGSIELQDGTRLVALTADGRPAQAGDGLAAQLVRSILAHDDTLLTTDIGTPGIVTVAPGPAGDLTELGIDVDQTHQSVIVSGRYVVKLVSAWGAADRAARQLQALAAAGSPDIPTFRGHLDWEHPELGRSTVALVSDYVPDAEDGWTWAVRDVLNHVQRGAAEPTWPGELGALTARLHLALATAAVPAAPADGGKMRTRAFTALDRALEVTEGTAKPRLSHRISSITASIDSIPDDPTCPMFAGHGDLHVGQVLRAAGGYWVVDLDGDPQLGADERDEPEPAARDLAHLLVSVDQVAAVVQRRVGGPAPACREWADRARADLLAAYLTELEAHGRRDLLDDRLLAGLEAEQVARELVYAARFLPPWTYAGEGTLVARYPTAPGVEEEPWTPPAFAPI